MKKHNFINSLVGQGFVLAIMIALSVGAIFAAFGEKNLYSEQAFLRKTQEIEQEESTATPEVKIEVIEPSATLTKTLTATQLPSPTVTSTKTQTKTLQKTKTPTPTSTQKETIATGEVCGPPDDWVKYQVQPGENLYRISLKFQTTVEELKIANCMGDSIVIISGQMLWVPNVATSTPFASETPKISKTNTPASSATLTKTNTVEPTPEDSSTLAITPTETLP